MTEQRFCFSGLPSSQAPAIAGKGKEGKETERGRQKDRGSEGGRERGKDGGREDVKEQ